MDPRGRSGVSTYIEVFILIGLAVGGSAAVFEAGLNATSSAQGPAVLIQDLSIRQGRYAAVERAAIFNAGDAPFSSFLLSTGGVSATASYCYTLYDPAVGTTVASTCPGAATGPGRVQIATSLYPGKGVVLELIIGGVAFSVGKVSPVTVTTSTGAQQSADVAVLPA